MAAGISKKNLLKDAGYSYNFDRMIYFNKRTKKVFSLDFIEDHNEADLQRFITEPSRQDWHFYFNAPPSGAVEQELKNILQ